MLPELELRLARDDSPDAGEFCRLFNALYARKVNERYYRWQFFESPCPSGLAVATLADGTWVGCYGFHILPATNLPSPISWSLDIMVAPAFQGQGLFGRLAAFAAAASATFNPAASCVMANAKCDRAHVRTLGWKQVAGIQTFTRGTTDLPEAAPAFVSSSYALLNPRQLAFVASRCRAPLVQQARSERYLCWRFAQNPWHAYSMVIVSRNSAPVAGAVLKTFKDPISGVSCGDIVDVVWSREETAPLREILLAALRHFRDAGITTANAWLQTNTLLDAVGTSLGFVPSSQTRHFSCSVRAPEFAGLELSSNWSLTMAAAEIF
jgi:hypothetical protein